MQHLSIGPLLISQCGKIEENEDRIQQEEGAKAKGLETGVVGKSSYRTAGQRLVGERERERATEGRKETKEREYVRDERTEGKGCKVSDRVSDVSHKQMMPISVSDEPSSALWHNALILLRATAAIHPPERHNYPAVATTAILSVSQCRHQKCTNASSVRPAGSKRIRSSSGLPFPPLLVPPARRLCCVLLLNASCLSLFRFTGHSMHVSNSRFVRIVRLCLSLCRSACYVVAGPQSLLPLFPLPDIFLLPQLPPSHSSLLVDGLSRLFDLLLAMSLAVHVSFCQSV